MARRITVSSLGVAPPPAPGPDTGERLRVLRDFWREQIEVVSPDCPDLIVLPELCDSFADDSPAQSRAWFAARGDEMIAFFSDLARQHRCHLVFGTGLVVKDGSARNAALFLDDRGEIIGQYHKNHLVPVEHEMFGFLCGRGATVVECSLGRIAGAVCFDLNFDELRLQLKAARPDLILFPSQYHGGFLQSYWAYSCRAHFVSCISTGNLPSQIISPAGHVLASSTNYFDHVTATVNLDCVLAHLDGNRAGKLDALKKKYRRDVSIFDPGHLGSVLITSESGEVSVADMVGEFEIELLDDYFARSLQHHRDPRFLEPLGFVEPPEPGGDHARRGLMRA